MFRSARFLCIAAVCLFPLIGLSANPAVTIAVFPSNPPSIFIDEDGQPKGIYIDLLDRILTDAGYAPEFIVCASFPEALDRTTSGEIDLIPQMAYRPERESILDLNKVAVRTGWAQIFIPDSSTVKSIMDLRGLRVGTIPGSQLTDRFDDAMKSFALPYEKVAFNDFDSIAEGIETGAIDAGVLPNTSNTQDYKIIATGIVFAPTHAYIATRKGTNQDVLSAIDEALSRTKGDMASYYYRILEKWTMDPGHALVPDWVKWASLALLAFGALLVSFVLLLRRQVRKGLSRIAEGEHRFRSLIENANDIIYTLSPEGTLTYVSPNWSEFMGESAESAVGASLLSYVHPEDGEKIKAFLHGIINSGQKQSGVEYRIRGSDGLWRWHVSNGSPLRNSEGNINDCIAIARDVTESRKMAVELRSKEVLLARILENLQDAYFQADLSGNFILANAAALRMYRFESMDDIIGSPAEKLYADPNDRSEMIQKLRNTGSIRDWSCKAMRMDGSSFWVSMNIQFVHDEEGRIIGTEGVVRDIMERMLAEEALQKSLDEKTMLLRELYHRTRNNMQVIMGMLHLQGEFSDDEAVRAILMDSQRRIRAMALVHERLYRTQDLSRLNLDEYISDLAHLLVDTYQAKTDPLALVLDLEPVSVSIDAAIPCGLVLNELISNSIKHAVPGTKNPEIRIGLKMKDSDCLSLGVSDNGPGLPDGFDFHSSNTMGALMIVSIVEHQLQGQFSVESDNGLSCRIQFRNKLGEERI